MSSVTRRVSLWSVVRARVATPQLIYGTLLISAVIGWAEEGDSARKVLVTAVSTTVVFWVAHVLCEALAHISAHPGHRRESFRAVLSAGIKAGFSHSAGLLYAGVLPCALLTLGVWGFLSDETSYWLALGLPVVSLTVLGWVTFRNQHLSWYVRAGAAACVSFLGVVIIFMKIIIH